MSKITVFKTIDSDSQSQYFEISEVLDRIKRGSNRKLIEEIRSEPNKQKRDSLKKRLLWICFSGEFTKRNNESMVQHSGFICLDFDGIEPKNMNLWRNKIRTNPHTYALFTSPSGNGLKAIWKIPRCQTNDEHNRRFEAIAERFKDCKYFDLNVKGWSRVCFESFDPNIYVNEDAELFESIADPVEIKTPVNIKSDTPVDVQMTFDNIVKWFEQNHNMRKGNRNQGAFTFASGVADYLTQAEAEPMLTSYIMSNVEQDQSDPFTSHECQICINQAYKNTPTPRKVMTFEDMPNISKELMPSDDELEFSTLQEPEKKTFWYFTGRGAIKVDYLSLKLFLESNGFFKYRFNPEDISFIRIIHNVVKIVTVDDIRDFVLDYLMKNEHEQAYNLFAESSKFGKNYIAFLELKKPKFIRDTKDTSWVFFKNTAVKIQASGMELVHYIDLDGYIWERQLIDRDFSIADPTCDYSTFVMHLAADDMKRFRSICSGLGYMMHRFKNPSTVRALIVNEEIISSEPMGGTGKGLLFMGMAQIRCVVFINGKNFNDGKSFVWQRVEPDTEIVVLDDPPRNFKFENLFSIQTTGWPIEKKNKGEIYLPPEDSPKIGIPTNYALKGSSDSHERRKFEIECHPHYSASYQPVDEFEKSFWIEWNKEEYLSFDNFMLSCIQFYLKNDLVHVDHVNLKIKKLIAETSEEFIEFAKFHLENNHRYNKNDTYKMFIEDNPGSYCRSSNQFYDWMRHYGKFKGWKTDDCGRGRMYIQFGEVSTPLPDTDNEIPF